MCKRLRHLGYFVQALLLSLSLFMSACSGKKAEPQAPSDSEQTAVSANDMVVFETDTTEWIVYTECANVTYGSGYSVKEPFHIPTRDEAKVLKDLTYGNGSQRFVTSDGYTFGMPSASVSKAGAKTKYSVLGLYIRRSAIIIEF